MATITEKLVILIDSNTGGAVKGLREVQSAATSAEKAALKSGASSNTLGTALERIGLSSGTAAKTAAIGIGGLGVAVGLAGLAVKAGVGSYTELASEIRSVQRVTGATADQASGFAAVARATGTDIGTLTTAAGRLGATLGNNPEALRKYGIEVARTKTGNVDVTETFLRVGDAVRTAADASQKDAIAKAAAGKSYKDLLPFMSRTREEQAALIQQARDRGQFLTQADLDQARDYQRNLNALGQEFKGFEQTIGRIAIGPLTGLISRVSQDLATARNFLHGQSLDDASRNAAEEYRRTIRGVADEEKQVAAQQEAIAASDAFNKQTGEVNTLRSALLGVLGAENSVTDAEKRVAATTADVATSRAKLNELLAKGTIDNEKLAAAVESAVQSHRHLEDAQDRLAASKKALDDLFKPATAGELTDASLAVTAATLAQADANRQLADAKQAADNAASFGTAADQAKAATDLERASLGVAQANRGLQKAEEDQQRARQQGQPTAEAVATAQRDLRRATDDLATATNDVAAKEEAARQAQLPDRARLDAIAAARKTLADNIDAQKQAVADLPAKIEAEANAQAALNIQIGAAPDAVAAYMGSLDQLAARSPAVATLRDRLNEIVASSTALGSAAAAAIVPVLSLKDAISADFGSVPGGLHPSGGGSGGGGPSNVQGIIDSLGKIEIGIGGHRYGLFGEIPNNAAGGIIRARPGGQVIRAGEAGHDEVVLSTDPSYAGRNAQLLLASGLASRGTSSASSGQEETMRAAIEALSAARSASLTQADVVRAGQALVASQAAAGVRDAAQSIKVEINQQFAGDPDREQVRAGVTDAIDELERVLRAR